MKQCDVREILSKIQNIRVGVVGDFCIDAYWDLDTSPPELSIETGKPTRAVQVQRYYLGGAGNVVENLIALGVSQVHAFAVRGEDLFGREFLWLLEKRNVRTEGVIVQHEGWQTAVYGKPYLGEEELERIDFGRFNRLNTESERALLAAVEAALPNLDALIVNQQITPGVQTQGMITGLNQLAQKFPNAVFLVDSRSKSNAFERMTLKLNAVEAARLCGDEVQMSEDVSEQTAIRYARTIHTRTGKPVFITRGARGIVVYDGEEAHVEPGILVMGQTDPVGAGDTATAAIASSLATGTSPAQAAHLGNLAASITVRKLRQTGTARPQEILELEETADYIFRPELAEDTRHARYVEGARIEIVNPNVTLGKIRHVIFDHDGTISTLREGWETIMEPVMVRAILGPAHDQVSDHLYRQVVRRVREYIDQSTGVQTIIQMEALVEMVREFGLVPEDQILDASGYKELYDKELLRVVRERLEMLRKGELNVADFTIKGAVAFLETLRDRGLVLYLASGTDREHVVHEAEALGYADLFEGRIYGALGDVKRYSKRQVIDRILAENKLEGCELACVGDGPVELRETRRKGGIAVGVASDEIKRFGWNMRKRTRLIQAGADLLVPDFSQHDKLIELILDNDRPAHRAQIGALP